MSFVGQLRPVDRRQWAPVWRPLMLLAFGYAVSATTIVGLVWLLGEVPHRLAPHWTELAYRIAAVWLVLSAVFNGQISRLHPPMLQRQTPLAYYYVYGLDKGALLWGLDTGTMVSTYRVTAGTWAILGLAFLDLLPWWSGLVYAAAFITSIAVSILLSLSAHHRPRHPAPLAGWARRWVSLATLGLILASAVAVSSTGGTSLF